MRNIPIEHYILSMSTHEAYPSQAAEEHADALQSTRHPESAPARTPTQQEVLEREFAALQRVGRIPFTSFLDEQLVELDPDVLETPVEEIDTP